MSRLLGPAPRTSRQFGSRLADVVAFREPWESVIADALDDQRCREVAASAQLMYLAESIYGPPEVRLAGLAEARDLSPAHLRECRAPAPHVGMPNYTGSLPVPHPHRPRSALTESLNERHQYMDLILTRPVAAFCAQPFRIAWRFQRGVRVHTPDAYLELVDGQRLLVDVTRSAKLDDPSALAIFAITAMTAALIGCDYQLRTELPAQRTLNVRHLWCYLTDDRPEDLDRWHEVAAYGRWPMPVREARQQFALGSAGLAAVWHLLARQVLFVELNQPITPDTVLSHTRCAEEEPWVVQL